MRIVFLTNEYPPHVYGGAGVHVEYLSRELRRLEGGAHRLDVLAFGDQADGQARGVTPPEPYPVADPRHAKVMDALQRCLLMAGDVGPGQADVLHAHTWYVALAGCLMKRLVGAPLVVTAHSLEPLRPWKREQLGAGYDASSWLERTAFAEADGVVAVSWEMREDIHRLYGVSREKTRIIHNGIDLGQFACRLGSDVKERYGIERDRPFILFVGRISRQKGILHLLAAAGRMRSDVQLVLAASSPDTEELRREVADAVAALRQGDKSVIWIEEMVPRDQLVCLYSEAAIFVCPSVYEPFGIINLEAMACQTPVVASRVGGVREVVMPGETGLLVDFQPVGGGDYEPRDPERFQAELAEAMDTLLASPDMLNRMGRNARRRVEEHFSWESVAAKTLDYYRDIVAARNEETA